MEIKEVKGCNITIYQFREYETMAYGSGSDWYTQRTDVTNHIWRRWFSSRALAEGYAKELIIRET